MSHRRVVAGVVAVALVAVVGYGALDAYDKVPGVLTLGNGTDDPGRTAHPSASAPSPSSTTATPTPEPTFGPRVAPTSNPTPPLPALDPKAPVPTKKGLRASLARVLGNKHLGNSVGVTIRDARTGRHLLDLGANEPLTPASTTKLLTAAAVSTTLDLRSRFTTKVVQGSSPNRIVLVAGGDSMLNPRHGDPTRTEGYAGLDELAAQVKSSLAHRRAQAAPTETTGRASGGKTDGSKGKGPVIRLALDDSFASGPLHAPGWTQGMINLGYVGGVTMLGLAGQRAVEGHPAPSDPQMTTAWAFRAALERQGLTVSSDVQRTTARSSAKTLGAVQSAPIGDILALALDQSDNALTEQLARVAAVQDGVKPQFATVAAWVERTVKGLGVHTKGVHLVDSCGLSDGTKIPARVIGDVLTLATTGKEPDLKRVLSHLPVAGLSGTLHERFLDPDTRSADGIARAKTGSLPGVSSLGGTVVDRDGRLLVYVLLADNVRPVEKPGKKGGGADTSRRPGSPGVDRNAWVAMIQVRRGLDAVVARLADCGCRS